MMELEQKLMGETDVAGSEGAQMAAVGSRSSKTEPRREFFTEILRKIRDPLVKSRRRRRKEEQ